MGNSDDSAVDLKCFSPAENNRNYSPTPTLKSSVEANDANNQYNISKNFEKRDNEKNSKGIVSSIKHPSIEQRRSLNSNISFSIRSADHEKSEKIDCSVDNPEYKERSVQKFNLRRDYVWAMREDISNWFNQRLKIPDITPLNMFQKLRSGVILCNHANTIYSKSF